VRAELGVVRDVVNKIRHRRLSYFGHVVSMARRELLILLLRVRVEGTQPRGRPKKRWLDVVREDCKIIGLTLPEAEHLAIIRRLWSRAVYWLLEHVNLSGLTSSSLTSSRSGCSKYGLTVPILAT